MNDKVNQPLLKGSLSVIILKLLETRERMYGYEITQQVKALTAGGVAITEGALYPALHKLEAEGLLTTETEVVDGRARKYYSLTKSGKNEAVSRVDELMAFMQNLQTILSPVSSTPTPAF
ncbi:PadR family transcriptional regulator [Fibrivirga algicola]|uniref:PadR family transcriptional regulator n=1 Tax=Fibrivirga algicola TaxID=2950420 RepID=A0ABX0QII4_9BACT|nr:PadR family transcriptional regulator [Fibrivirga algicola]ARK10550.1 PadR family transcriptional regulator [Fibrella sp. ES10-3-2-2]NID12064.1 PadR family transcriptional regulator [Fibrivirga algicola]